MTRGRNVFIVIAAAFAAFVAIFGMLATELLEGPSLYKETSYVTLAFKNVGGELRVEGLVGVSGENPTIIMRSSIAHQMILRVVNHDSMPHQFIIDGLNISTKILEAEEDGVNYDILTLSGGKEGVYTYRDALSGLPMGGSG